MYVGAACFFFIPKQHIIFDGTPQPMTYPTIRLHPLCALLLEGTTQSVEFTRLRYFATISKKICFVPYCCTTIAQGLRFHFYFKKKNDTPTAARHVHRRATIKGRRRGRGKWSKTEGLVFSFRAMRENARERRGFDVTAVAVMFFLFDRRSAGDGLYLARRPVLTSLG